MQLSHRRWTNTYSLNRARNRSFLKHAFFLTFYIFCRCMASLQRSNISKLIHTICVETVTAYSACTPVELLFLLLLFSSYFCYFYFTQPRKNPKHFITGAIAFVRSEKLLLIFLYVCYIFTFWWQNGYDEFDLTCFHVDIPCHAITLYWLWAFSFPLSTFSSDNIAVVVVAMLRGLTTNVYPFVYHPIWFRVKEKERQRSDQDRKRKVPDRQQDRWKGQNNSYTKITRTSKEEKENSLKPHNPRAQMMTCIFRQFVNHSQTRHRKT